MSTAAAVLAGLAVAAFIALWLLAVGQALTHGITDWRAARRR